MFNLKKKPSFFLSDITSPSRYQIHKHLLQHGFEQAHKPSKATFSDRNLTLSTDASEYLEYKHLLTYMLQQHSPAVIPLSYIIDDNNYSEVLNEINQKHHQLDNKYEHPVWILKPSLLNNGQHIKIFNSFNALNKHYSTNLRLGGEHVLQQYITKPALIEGHKYSLRLFVVLTNHKKAFLYKDGYFNVSTKTYNENDFDDLSLHITNEHFNGVDNNVEQIPTKAVSNFATHYQQAKNIIFETLHALQKEAPSLMVDPNIPAFDFFGFDFIMDQDSKLWLLEVNHAPCFPVEDDHPLQQALYHHFWEDVLDAFVIPIMNKPLIKHFHHERFDEIE
jgi:hypothetical protein